MNPSFDRRGFLTFGAVGAAGAVGLLAGCSSDDDTTASAGTTAAAPAETTATSSPTTVSAAPAASSELTAADFAALATCVLLPEKTAGPFPLDEQFDRRDITEGLTGHPLRLGLRVVDDGCAPVPGATVEIWHCDATGDYSAFTDGGGGKDDGAGTTFLRGTQTANDEGIVEFATIYPGWYRGRAVHIHLRVHRDEEIVLTSQLFFDAGYTEGVYAADPYAENGLPDTSNESDSIAGDPADEGTLVATSATTVNGVAGTLGLVNLAIAA